MRLLWLSNFSSPSAYALQSRLYIPRIKACGHDVTVLELANGRFPARIVEGVDILPVGKDPLGSDTILEHFRRGGFHAVISLVDPWGMNPDVMKHVPWFPFSPIDTMPVSPRNVRSLSASTRPIAITRWGQAEIAKIPGLPHAPLYLPHGFDPAVFKPIDRAKAREALGIPPNVFFAAFVGVNDSLPSRKGLDALLFVWQAFCHSRDDVLLYLHTDPQGNIPEVGERGGVDVDAMLTMLNMRDDPRIKLADVHRYRTFSIPHSELALIASAADVLINPGAGEGFGVPIIEFAACGTPAIVTNFGSMAELADQMGGQLLNFEPTWSYMNAMTARVLFGELMSALEKAYSERGTPAAQERRNAALKGAQTYNIDRVFHEHGIPVLETIAEMTMEAVR
jgi:glycosyltransferase involved in cell wall biosynthesis